MILVTHSGYPHADDMFAYAVLRLIFPYAALIRTRVENQIEKGDIIFDVGGKFDGIRHFDHHQLDAELREDGTKYSAFGLIWKFYGKEFIRIILEEEVKYFDEVIPEGAVKYIWELLDQSIVLEIDKHDNGVEKSAFAVGLGDATGNSDEEFHETAVFCTRYLKKKVLSGLVRMKDDEIIFNGELIFDGRAIIMDSELEDMKSLEKWVFYPNLLFVVVPRGAKQWQVLTIRKGDFDNRRMIHEEGAGLNRRELYEATGNKDLVFVHAARFIAVSDTKEGAIQCVKMSM